MSPVPSERPPEIVAATEEPIVLTGAPVSVKATVPSSTQSLLSGAVDVVASTKAEEGKRVYLNVEDIQADANPGVVYGVYVNLPRKKAKGDRDRHHIGNITLFGIEAMNEAEPEHEGVPGFRHTFDITSHARKLRKSGRWSSGELTVTFELELPEPPPGYKGDPREVLSEQLEWARATPVRVGRVSVFVG